VLAATVLNAEACVDTGMTGQESGSQSAAGCHRETVSDSVDNFFELSQDHAVASRDANLSSKIQSSIYRFEFEFIICPMH